MTDSEEKNEISRNLNDSQNDTQNAVCGTHTYVFNTLKKWIPYIAQIAFNGKKHIICSIYYEIYWGIFVLEHIKSHWLHCETQLTRQNITHTSWYFKFEA